MNTKKEEHVINLKDLDPEQMVGAVALARETISTGSWIPTEVIAQLLDEIIRRLNEQDNNLETIQNLRDELDGMRDSAPTSVTPGELRLIMNPDTYIQAAKSIRDRHNKCALKSAVDLAREVRDIIRPGHDEVTYQVVGYLNHAGQLVSWAIRSKNEPIGKPYHHAVILYEASSTADELANSKCKQWAHETAVWLEDIPEDYNFENDDVTF